MAIYFSERAAKRALAYGESKPPKGGIAIGKVKLDLDRFTQARTVAEELMVAADLAGRSWADTKTAKANDVVDIELEEVTYGAVRTAGVQGSRKPFWTFLLRGTQRVVGVAPTVVVMGVGSVDNYSDFAGDEKPLRGTWFSSSPEGRADVYRKLDIITENARDQEFDLFDTNIDRESAPGRQVELFEDLIESLNHNQAMNTWDIDHYMNQAGRVRLMGIVEDVRQTQHAGVDLLIRPILIEQMG